jgi:glutamine amidotransferase
LIGIVNYGLGNVQAIANIYHRLNIPAVVASSGEELDTATRVVLPGVGAFDWAMERLNTSGLRGALEGLVIGRGASVLGICVGMQMLARRSDEGVLPGLGWIPGEVRRIGHDRMEVGIRLPHMGWNDVAPRNGSGLFRGLSSGARFYFLHSYQFVPDDDAAVLATTDYHGALASAVSHGRVSGVQFHPEKSHEWGIQLLRNFAEAA